MQRVQYLGYIMDEPRVHVDPTKVQVIFEQPTLMNLTELHSFLGLSNFYHILMLWFSHITWSIIQVTNGGSKAKFVWAKP